MRSTLVWQINRVLSAGGQVSRKYVNVYLQLTMYTEAQLWEITRICQRGRRLLELWSMVVKGVKGVDGGGKEYLGDYGNFR